MCDEELDIREQEKCIRRWCITGNQLEGKTGAALALGGGGNSNKLLISLSAELKR